MKLKTLLLIITPIIFLLTGCNNAPSAVHSEETVPITTETPVEVVETPESSPSPVKESTASGEVEGEVVKSESVENEQINPYDYIDGSKHITDNLDGTYTITEEYAGTLSMFDYFDGMTKSEIEAELGDWLGGTLKYAVKAEEAEEFISSLKRTEAVELIDTPSSSTENTGASNSETSNNGSTSGSNSNGNSGNSNPSNNGNSNSSGGNSTPSQSVPQAEDDGFDDLIQNPDGTLTTPDGTFTFDDPSTFGVNENGEIERIDTGGTIYAGGSSVEDEIITDPDYELNLDPSVWGDAITDKIGEGGEYIIPEGFNGIH